METEVLGGKPSSFEEGIINWCDLSSKQESMGLVAQNLCFIKKTNLLSQVEDP